MLSGHKLEILAVIAVLAFSLLFLAFGRGSFTGTDDQAAARVSEMTGIPREQFRPVVWQWVPPSPEVESGLFALQGAVGGIIVGWFFGYWKGSKGQGKS